jgi:hypothetical protein
LPAGVGERLEHGRPEPLEGDHVLRSAKAGEIGEGGVQHRLDGGGRECQAVRRARYVAGERRRVRLASLRANIDDPEWLQLQVRPQAS